MIDPRLPFVLGVTFNYASQSWIPCALCIGLLVIIEIIKPGSVRMKHIRIGWCIRTAVLFFLLIPWVCSFAPSGGEEEQRWLDEVIVCLEQSRAECDDPEMKEIIDYTIRRYHHVGQFNVQVVQLPEEIIGFNPLCPGVMLDENLTEYHPVFGAHTLVHEAMHDYWPYFGHAYIDDDRIWDNVVSPNCKKL